MKQPFKSMPVLVSLAFAVALIGCGAPVDEPVDAGHRADAAPTLDAGAPLDAASRHDAGLADAGAAVPDVDAGPLIAPGEPIDVPSNEWVWVPMSSMRCANGTEGGFAVNFTEDREDLVIYLQGGGICYDAITCAASLIDSVGPDPLSTAIQPSVTGNRGIFDRADASNPFRQASFVVLPHCTGDHHVGDAVTRYGAREVVHHGYANVTRLTERLIATFADARRVSVTGFSAGGVGAAGNYHQIARAFESIGGPTPYFVDDAGPFLRNEYLDDFAQNRLRESWNLDATVGTYCPECLEEGVHRVYEANARLHPAVRASLLCAYEDSVVATLYSVMNRNAFTGARLRRGLGDLADSLHTADGFRVFFYAGARHGALHEPLSSTAGLSDFLTAQVTDATWDSVRP